MKLRTKIICIASAVIFLALLAGNLIIYAVCSNAVLREAVNAAYVETSEVKNSFDHFSSQLNGNIGIMEAGYHFKTNRDDYTVCANNGEEYYNNTVLSLDEISGGEYKNVGELAYREGIVAGRNILVFRSVSSHGMELYHIVDISGVYDELNMLAMVMLGVSLVIIVVSVGVLAVVVKRTLKPLDELSEGAKGIAQGSYDKRVAVRTHDEIGALAKDFNIMAQAVETHTKEIEESEERKTLFMGNLTHELKTPLTAISGYAQTMKVAELSADDKDEALTFIYEEAKRLDRLSKKMMRVLCLDREAQITMQDIPVRELFETVVKTCETTANDQNVSICIGERDGIVHGDRDLMCDVLINLIDNAIKASSDGSSVKLYTENDAIIVQDFGCGIPESEITKITEPFYMVDKSRSRKNGGAGLGLALVKLILRHHGMEMRFYSEVGRGTKVCVYKSFATR